VLAKEKTASCRADRYWYEFSHVRVVRKKRTETATFTA
jgi:hypothetical protein